jgi:hypothetical protein
MMLDQDMMIVLRHSFSRKPEIETTCENEVERLRGLMWYDHAVVSR